MNRGIISRLRHLLVGPVLNRFSRMTPGQVEALILMASDESAPLSTRTDSSMTSPSPAVADHESRSEITSLKSKLAELTERVDVLERIYQK